MVHTHSTCATAWAQAGLAIPCMGTTHADYFHGDIPVTRFLTPEETEEDYEGNTGKVIIEAFQGKNPMHTPGVLANGHGPFTWGKNGADAVYNAVVLEELSKMALMTRALNPRRGRTAASHQRQAFPAQAWPERLLWAKLGRGAGIHNLFLTIYAPWFWKLAQIALEPAAANWLRREPAEKAGSRFCALGKGTKAPKGILAIARMARSLQICYNKSALDVAVKRCVKEVRTHGKPVAAQYLEGLSGRRHCCQGF